MTKSNPHLPVRSKPKQQTLKKGLHPRNLHIDGYDFEALIDASKELKPFVRPNPYGNLSIDFADAKAVKALNLALLRQHYGVEHWDIPAGFLCPPIPGRVDYLHYIADLISEDVAKTRGKGGVEDASGQSVSKRVLGRKIKVLDIGTGANGIYPILGIASYGWQFVASDIDPVSLDNVKGIIEANVCLQGRLETRLQASSSQIFAGIIGVGDRFDITMCNPPFHGSLAEATVSSKRKLDNLAANRVAKGHDVTPRIANASGGKSAAHNQERVDLNFGGQKAELWCPGGELAFLNKMIMESQQFASQCLWFTSLVSKKENLEPCYLALEKAGAVTVNTIDMTQGNKMTRVLAWSFLTPAQRGLWAKYRG